MAIPRRLIMIAVGAVGAGVALYLRNRALEQKQREREQGFKDDNAPPGGRDGDDIAAGSSASGSESASGSGSGSGSASGSQSASGSGSASASAASPVPGAAKELAQFLAGESWFDEVGWNGIWDREGIDAPEAWLKTKGKEVLAAERKKLVDHPALLAGCRRRWIVVCRYAGIDVTDAAATWSQIAE